MRTVSEEETLEIAKIIQEIGEKMYSKNGAKFVAEAKKFLNEEPCWEKEKELDDVSCRGISILGGGHRGRVVIIGNHIDMGLRLNIRQAELADFPWESIEQLNGQSKLALVIEKLEEKFGSDVLRLPTEIIEQKPIPFTTCRLCEEYDEEIKRVISKNDSKQNRLRVKNHNVKASKLNIRTRPRINRKK